MSSGADCAFIEAENNSWTYKLQEWPYGEWEEYTTYGPFPTYTAAVDHLDREHQNPGGWSIRTQPEGKHRHDIVTGGYNQTGPARWDDTLVHCDSCGVKIGG